MRPNRRGNDSPSKFIAYIAQSCVVATQSNLFSEFVKPVLDVAVANFRPTPNPLNFASSLKLLTDGIQYWSIFARSSPLIVPSGFLLILGNNSMNAVMDQSLWLSIIFLLNFASVKAETLKISFEAGAGSCPLNMSKELDAHPWMISQCSGQDKSHCCESIRDLIKILHFSWMHTTGSFVFPTNYTAAVCLNEFHRQLEARTGIGAQALFSGCKVRPQSLVSDSSTCLGIENRSTFESRVDSSDMKLKCNASRRGDFQCNKCLRAMAMALASLNEGSGGKSNCPLFVMIYVGGGINCYDCLGPDAAFCLQSAQNLTSLAAYPVQRNRVRKIYLLVAIPAVGILIVVLSICVYLNARKSRLRNSKRKKSMQRYEVLSASTGLTFFSLSEIRDFTGNFAASNVVGKGGFSTVYRGTLPNGSRIAVKRLKYSAKIKEAADLSHELRVISSIKHCNLLPLKGYCIEFNEYGQISEQLLVSDLMENGSLADCLFNPRRSTCLSWPERYKIAVDIARGLTYLHEFAKPAIIHRDVKAANVLLDAHLNAIVTDFGLAKLRKEEEEEKTHYSTRTVGTLGYVAPEYALYGHLTVKSDVFSFGIILLELITGRRALNSNSSSGDVEHLLLSDWVYDMTQNNRTEEAIDKRMEDLAYRKTIEKVLILALRCAHPRVVSRPSMSEVLLFLEAIDGKLSGTNEIESELEAFSNSRGDFTWFLYEEMRTDESTVQTEERTADWSISSSSAID